MSVLERASSFRESSTGSPGVGLSWVKGICRLTGVPLRETSTIDILRTNNNNYYSDSKASVTKIQVILRTSLSFNITWANAKNSKVG